MWEEHVNAAGRGSTPSVVTLEARRGDLVLTVGRPALELMPWYRGGMLVAVMVGRGADAGRIRVMRGDTHRLLARVGGFAGVSALEKLPPVELRMDAFGHMARDAEHAPEPVAHRIDKGALLEVTLPAWAAPPVPTVAPATSYAPGHYLPAERAGRAAVLS